MKILLIEDNSHKREKMVNVIQQINSRITIDEASSYQEGLKFSMSNLYSLLIIDMSIPTYSKSDSEGGGRFRTFGGKEIIMQLSRKNKLKPFIVVSQFSTFSEKSGVITLDEIDKDLRNSYGEYFIKTIFYDTTNTTWKEELTPIIKNLLNND